MCAMVLAYVSAIQDISLSPVLMSGAGTSMPGPGGGRGGEGELVKHVSHSAGMYTSTHFRILYGSQ